MMSELQGIQQSVKPSDTLLVVDAMTGQEAAGLVKAFNDAAPLTGSPLSANAFLLEKTKNMLNLLSRSCLSMVRTLAHNNWPVTGV